MTSEALAARSMQILGADLRNGGSPEGNETAAPYEIGGQRPSFVAPVQSAEEVAGVIRCAAAEKLALIPCSGRSKLHIGGIPARYDIALDTSKLNRIIAYDPGDLTLSVEPGCTISTLNAALAERGQFLPLAGPFRDQATVGGIIASGVDSPLRQRYGTARDFVLGMEFVTGDAQAAKSGGRVVKNVTGYDMHKLMIGALGTLGVLTRINFRTFPLPSETAALIASFDSLTRAVKLRHRIDKSALAPLTLDIVNWGSVNAGLAGKPAAASIKTFDAGWSVICGFADSGAAKARYERELIQMADVCGAANPRIVDQRTWETVFDAICNFAPLCLNASPAAVILKLAVLPQQIAAACQNAVECAQSGNLRWAAVARGVGVIYLALLPDADDAESESKAVQVASQIGNAIEKLGGYSTIPWCPSAWKPKLQIWGSPRSDFAQMKKIKSIFDPLGVLSPGRFVGGL